MINEREDQMPEQDAMVEMTADIVSAYLSHNTVRASELAELIATVHASLSGINAPKPVEEPAPQLKPAVPIKKSVTDEYIISLEDGRKFKSMKRYLSLLGMTPDDYRARWGLPRDYPMVAPGYAAKRSELARASGLGSGRRSVAPSADSMDGTAPDPVGEDAPTIEPEVEAPANDVAPEAAPKRRGRPKKAA